MNEGQTVDRRDFDIVTARHGIEVPPGLEAGAIAVFNEVAEAAKMVRRPRAMTAEAAYIFSLGTLVRDSPGTR